MKTYTGRRDRDGNVVIAVIDNGKRRPLNARNDLSNHSPTGFEYGYGGSGPAQLALAILADVLGNDALALRHHQDFKWAYIADFGRNAAWEISEQEVRDFVRLHPTEEARRGR